MATSRDSDRDDQPKKDDQSKKPESEVDQAIEESFPASDPPGHSGGGAATPTDEEHAAEQKHSADSEEKD